MKDLIYIFGHKNPDTDSICSAIAYAEFKRKLGYNAVPKRLGEINRETEFVLNYFQVSVPEKLETVKTQVCDLNLDIVNPASPDISIKTAWMIMKKHNIKTLPVVDENERLLGVVTLSDITKRYMDILENNLIASCNTSLMNIVETLNGKVIVGDNNNFKVTGKVSIAAMTPEKMESFIEKGDLVICGNLKESQIQAIQLGANVIVITGGSQVDKEVIELAKEKECVVLVTPTDTFTTARLINQSIHIGYIMTTDDIVTFHIDDFIEEIKDRMLQTRFRNYPIIDEFNKVKGLVARYHLISQRRKKVILVDHNEKSQTVNGIEEADILEIIDHHRVGDIQSNKPIFFKNEPVGSTATIIANIYFDNGIRPSKNIAGILCAAIISDTLNFKSPTCTYVDKVIAEKLSEIANIDIEEFTYAMFKAGTSLQGRKPAEIFYQDFKEFQLGNYKIGIAQINTMDRDSLTEIKENLLLFMKDICENKNYNILILLVTDILEEGSELLFVGSDKALISKAFNVSADGNSVYLPGVVSRKKQVVPPLSIAAEE